jgi:hypothetical protein
MSPAPDCANAVQECTINPMMPQDSFCTIPARINNTFTKVNAIVSPEDFERLTAISDEWYVSSNGYVVTSKRVDKKYIRKYMHKVVMGTSATHVNGDRLDNRRRNLAIKPRKRAAEIPMEELELKSALPLEVDSTNVPFSGKNVIVDYKHKDMVYHGEIHDYMPHGFGTLHERKKTSMGWWFKGYLKKGIITEHGPLPTVMQRTVTPQMTKGPVKKAFAWWDNRIVYGSET